MEYRRNFTVFITAKTPCELVNCEQDCKSSIKGAVCTCTEDQKPAADNKSCTSKMRVSHYNLGELIFYCFHKTFRNTVALFKFNYNSL